MLRARFAPSPTGYLHIGSARTFIFNWLYVRKHHGAMVLRIDDTDEDRNTEASLNSIYEGLNFLDLGWDEFYRETARRFAQHGFQTLCPDLYCRFGHGTPDDVTATARGAPCRNTAGPECCTVVAPRPGSGYSELTHPFAGSLPADAVERPRWRGHLPVVREKPSELARVRILGYLLMRVA